MMDQMDWDRLARYVSGEAGADERQAVERWAAQSPGNGAMLDAARRRWNAAIEPGTWDVDAAWKRLQPQLARAGEGSQVLPLAPRRTAGAWVRAARIVPLAVAAGLLLAVGVSLVSRAPAGPAVATTPDATTFTTAVGEQRPFNLPDGSEVLLGATSTLRVDPAFGGASREVFLEGQAFIRVVHDAARPFVVRAGGTRTVDLGTAFEVRAYPREEVRVVVTEGSVEVRRERADSAPVAVLQAGDVVRLTDSAADIRRQQDVSRLLSWTRGELSFVDAPLSDIAQELERWFDIDCRIDNRTIEAMRLTLDFRIGESLDEMLKVVELVLSDRGVRAERNGRTVTFRSGTPASPAARPAPRTEVGA
jgi:ferric-dicitrate binding protein FerR (iron transport regulator)